MPRLFRLALILLLAVLAGLLGLACGDDGDEEDEPGEVVVGFMADLADASPPTSDPEALERARDRLTLRSSERLADGTGIGPFLGVQDLPDEDVTIEETDEEGDLAVVRARLHYSGGDALRDFHMERAQDRWRIDWVDHLPLTQESTPEMVVEAFLAHAFGSAPPAGHEQAAAAAASLLTADARESLDDTAVMSGQLALLLGVQDVPDRGYEVGAARVDGDEASVEAALNYSGGATSRTFYLDDTDDGWRIDSISD